MEKQKRRSVFLNLVVLRRYEEGTNFVSLPEIGARSLGRPARAYFSY
jgi:hypothetical protein